MTFDRRFTWIKNNIALRIGADHAILSLPPDETAFILIAFSKTALKVITFGADFFLRINLMNNLFSIGFILSILACLDKRSFKFE